MISKTYLNAIQVLQELLLGLGLIILVVLPVLLAYFDNVMPESLYTTLFSVSLWAVFLVMSIRPLADLFPNVSWLRPLVILRKGFGVLSASLIIAVMFSRILSDGLQYFVDFVRPDHWSVASGAVLAPLGDLSALILLITSNKFSKRVLGANWKRVQKLAYVYFYAGAFYEFILLHQVSALVAAIVVSILVIAAFVYKRLPKPALV